MFFLILFVEKVCGIEKNKWYLLGMSMLASIENTFSYTLLMLISEDFCNVSFPCIGFLSFCVNLHIGKFYF